MTSPGAKPRARTRSAAYSRRVALRFLLIGALSFAAWTGDRAAFADVAPGVADRLFSEGLELARKGDCARARASFASSYAADAAPGTLINWGLCEEKLGRTATAFALLRVAEQRLPVGHPKIAEVKNELAALVNRVPYLRMHALRPLPPGTVVRKDAEPVELASLDQPQPIDPGAHVIEVHAPGHEVRSYEVALGEGRTLDLAFEPGAPTSRTPPTMAERGGDAGDHRTLGWIIGGVGATAVGVGAVTGLLALSRWHDVQHDCDIEAKTCRTDEGVDASPAGRSLATVSTIAFVAGGVGLLGGAYLVLSPRRPASSGVRPAVISLTATGSGIQLSGKF